MKDVRNRWREFEEEPIESIEAELWFVVCIGDGTARVAVLKKKKRMISDWSEIVVM